VGRRILVTDYDPTWWDAYVAEHAELAKVFAPIAESLHHIGSTSVPGMMAKPTIDILVIVRVTRDLASYDPAMITLGYRPRGECLDAGGTPGRFYYSKDVNGIRTHHVHICQSGHWQIVELLAFPAYLRSHPGVARSYAELKRLACRDGGSDNAQYMAKKAEWLPTRIAAAVAEFGDRA